MYFDNLAGIRPSHWLFLLYLMCVPHLPIIGFRCQYQADAAEGEAKNITVIRIAVSDTEASNELKALLNLDEPPAEEAPPPDAEETPPSEETELPGEGGTESPAAEEPPPAEETKPPAEEKPLPSEETEPLPSEETELQVEEEVPPYVTMTLGEKKACLTIMSTLPPKEPEPPDVPFAAKDSQGNDLPPPVPLGETINTTAYLTLKGPAPPETNEDEEEVPPLEPCPLGEGEEGVISCDETLNESLNAEATVQEDADGDVKASLDETATVQENVDNDVTASLDEATPVTPEKDTNGDVSESLDETATVQEDADGDVTASLDEATPVPTEEDAESPYEPLIVLPALAGCRLCTTRVNPIGGGVKLTCCGCQDMREDRACHTKLAWEGQDMRADRACHTKLAWEGQKDPILRVQARYYEIAGFGLTNATSFG